MARARHFKAKYLLPILSVAGAIGLFGAGVALGWYAGAGGSDRLLLAAGPLRPVRHAPAIGAADARLMPVRHSGIISGVDADGALLVRLDAREVAAGAPETVRLWVDGSTPITAWLPKSDAEIERETGQSRSLLPGQPAPVPKDVAEQYRQVRLQLGELAAKDVIHFESLGRQDSGDWRARSINWIASLVGDGRNGEVYLKGRFPKYEK